MAADPLHPRDAEIVEWDEGNLGELDAHKITAAEVEQVWRNRPTFARNKKDAAGDWKMMGRSDGGRRLTIVVVCDEVRRTMRPITGWNSTAGELTRYFPR